MWDHAMLFGAVVAAEGVRFRLWAPDARKVELRLDDGNEPRLIPMRRTGDGWYELGTDAARPCARYRYRIDDRIDVPDPASRFQPDDVHAASMVVDPSRYEWTRAMSSLATSCRRCIRTSCASGRIPRSWRFCGPT